MLFESPMRPDAVSFLSLLLSQTDRGAYYSLGRTRDRRTIHHKERYYSYSQVPASPARWYVVHVELSDGKGGKIVIPIFKRGETHATCRNVSQYCMVWN